MPRGIIPHFPGAFSGIIPTFQRSFPGLFSASRDKSSRQDMDTACCKLCDLRTKKWGCAVWHSPRYMQCSAASIACLAPPLRQPLAGVWKRGSPCQFKRRYVVGPSSSERTSSLSSTFTILVSTGVKKSLLSSGKKLAAMFCLY